MEHLHDCDSFQLVDGDGIFDKDRLDKFTEKLKLANCGNSYSIISIIGPQSSGKSTLLNHLFGTNFNEMNATATRGQTTRGIWLARCSGSKRCTLVLDLEGTDGVERARTQDGAAFEKQSALFALAVSNIVLINISCKDIGLENAASRPLLRTVFEVMIRLFSPRRVTLMFVLRDKTRTPSGILEDMIHKDVKELWESIEKPQRFKQTELSKFFNVEAQILPNYEYCEEEFKEQVGIFRERLFLALEGGEGSRDHQALVPGSEFSASAKEIWKCAKENKDFDVPSHQELIAGKRCADVITERINAFKKIKEFRQLKSAAQSDSAWIPGLCVKMNNMFKACLDMYDQDTQHYNVRVRDDKRNDLSNQLLKIGHEEVCIPVLWKLQSETVEKFIEMLEKSVQEGKQLFTAARSCKQSCIAFFDQRCAEIMVQEGSPEASRIRDKLVGDIDTHADNEKDKAHIRESEKKKRSVAVVRAVCTTVGSVAGAAGAAAACVLTGGTAAFVVAPAVVGSSALFGGSSYIGAHRFFDQKKATLEND
ncbi:hypothetical protein Droror1_Dr00006411 [Drosera rotundifolia]